MGYYIRMHHSQHNTSRPSLHQSLMVQWIDYSWWTHHFNRSWYVLSCPQANADRPFQPLICKSSPRNVDNRPLPTPLVIQVDPSIHPSIFLLRKAHFNIYDNIYDRQSHRFRIFILPFTQLDRSVQQRFPLKRGRIFLHGFHD